MNRNTFGSCIASTNKRVRNDGRGKFIAWKLERGGPYMPTPIVYRGHLYVCPNNGLLSCYDAKTGERIYRKRLKNKNGYTASPVAAD